MRNQGKNRGARGATSVSGRERPRLCQNGWPLGIDKTWLGAGRGFSISVIGNLNVKSQPNISQRLNNLVRASCPHRRHNRF